MSTDLLETLMTAPYVKTFGVRLEEMGDELTGILPYAENLVGNPLIPALHGGAVGAFMEIVASAALLTAQPQSRLPKPIDIAVDYLRPARDADMFARAIVARSGRRVANVRVEAWQGRKSAPVATMHGHFLMTPARDGSG